MIEKENYYYNCRHLEEAKYASADWMGRQGITNSGAWCAGSARLRAPWRRLAFSPQPSPALAQASCIGRAQRRMLGGSEVRQTLFPEQPGILSRTPAPGRTCQTGSLQTTGREREKEGGMEGQRERLKTPGPA